MKRNHGFTLIEMLVVIGIIGFLASALTIASVGLKQRAKIEKAQAQVLKIDTGAEAYFTKFQAYPGNYAKGTTPSIIDDSTTLYEYLGKPLKAIEGFGSTAKTREMAPILDLVDSELAGTPSLPFKTSIIDPWMKGIVYSLPGLAHGSIYTDQSKRFDVRSFGPNTTDDMNPVAPTDDIANWTINRK